MSRELAVRPLQPGLRLRHYTLTERIGIGTDGEVWAATDPHGADAALKIRPQLRGEERGGDGRLRQEFERLRRLRIPNVVRVLETGADQGYVFFAMERAWGLPFDQHAARRGGTPGARVPAVAAAGAAVARALAGIHRLGLAHRDVKPANVLVDDHGMATVLDFGTARFAAAAEGADGGRRAGTAAFMAPEQRLGLPHDQRVDLYALGAMLHEAISGVQAHRHAAGARRPSLALLDPGVPRALAALVDALLSLDPAERPSAARCQDLLERVAAGSSLPPAPWPEPVRWLADPSPLLGRSAVIIGEPGTGRRRLVDEARRKWFRDGYRSVAAACGADRPYSALAAIVDELLAPLDGDRRRALLGRDGPLLAGACPGLALDADTVPLVDPDPKELGHALARLLARLAEGDGPLALVLWDVDEADPGTARTLPVLVRAAPASVRIWATGRRPGFGLAAMRPPRWSAAAEAAMRAELLPAGPAGGPPLPPAATPLLSLLRAWRELARVRGEEGPADPLPAGLSELAVLDLPFPREVAEALSPSVPELLAAGVLVPEEPVGGDDERTAPREHVRLRPADLGTWRLAWAQVARNEDALARARARAARAWRKAEGLPEHRERAAELAARSGQDPARALDEAIAQELGRGRPALLDRWLRLRTLHAGGPEQLLAQSGGLERAFELSYARLLVELELRPTAVHPADLSNLADRARTPRQEALAAYLRVVHDARRGDRATAAALGRRQADAVRQSDPVLAADLMREVALAGIARGELATAAQDARTALALARRGAAGGGPGRSEVSATTTLSAALLYAGRVREAVELCGEGAARFQAAGVHRGEGALLANRAIGHLFLGQRDAAEADLARGRAVQPLHHDPVVLANLAVTRARLAVEGGDVQAGGVLIDEALTAAAASGDPHLHGEAWCTALEAALHAADPAEASRAIQAYSEPRVGSAWDHWPAVLARWRWLTGDLQGALAATEEPREGHGDLCIRAERVRLLLVGGQYPRAEAEARHLADAAEAVDQLELAAFARLVHGAATAAPDAAYLPQVRATRRSRWVHLYLGALHLDAVRRRLRGENVSALLRQLDARASDVGHRLYSALARARGW